MWIKYLVGTTALAMIGSTPLVAQQADGTQYAQYGGYSQPPYGGYQPYSGPPPYQNYQGYSQQQQQPNYGAPQYGGNQQPGYPQQQQYGSYGPPQQGQNQQYGSYGPPQQDQNQQYGSNPPPQGAPQYNVAGVPQYGGPPQQQGMPQQGQDQQQGDVVVFTEATVAALKASLKLTADQEKNWPAFEAATRDLAKLRADRAKQLEELEPKPVQASAPSTATPAATPAVGAARPAAGTPGAAAAPSSAPSATPASASAPKPADTGLVEGLQSEAEALSKHGAALKKFADAVGPLYKSLDDAQKTRFMEGAGPLLPQSPPISY